MFTRISFVMTIFCISTLFATHLEFGAFNLIQAQVKEILPYTFESATAKIEAYTAYTPDGKSITYTLYLKGPFQGLLSVIMFHKKSAGKSLLNVLNGSRSDFEWLKSECPKRQALAAFQAEQPQ